MTDTNHERLVTLAISDDEILTLVREQKKIMAIKRLRWLDEANGTGLFAARATIEDERVVRAATEPPTYMVAIGLLLRASEAMLALHTKGGAEACVADALGLADESLHSVASLLLAYRGDLRVDGTHDALQDQYGVMRGRVDNAYTAMREDRDKVVYVEEPLADWERELLNGGPTEPEPDPAA